MENSIFEKVILNISIENSNGTIKLSLKELIESLSDPEHITKLENACKHYNEYYVSNDPLFTWLHHKLVK